MGFRNLPRYPLAAGNIGFLNFGGGASGRWRAFGTGIRCHGYSKSNRDSGSKFW
jgi:hypothetical protein